MNVIQQEKRMVIATVCENINEFQKILSQQQQPLIISSLIHCFPKLNIPLRTRKISKNSEFQKLSNGNSQKITTFNFV